ATGDATNIHEIRNLRIRTITNAPAPDLTLQKQPNTDTFIAGGTGEYTLTVKNVGQGPTYGPVTVTDTLPPGFSLASVTTPGWSCSENPAGKVTCIYSGDLRSTNPATDPVISPDESQSLVLRVNVPKTPDEYTNTAIVTTDADSNPTNNQAQAKVRVEPVGQPRLRLVKRITRVNETPYTDVVDDPTDANDDPGVWPVGLQPVGLANLSDQSPVQSGDEVEYTVYFLSDGAQTAQNIQICDPIPAQTTFDPNSFGSGTGIVLNQNQATTNLSNDSDTDAGTFFSPLTPVTAPCPDTNNPNGAVVVRVGDIPNTPPNNAGFVRFRVKID
ncbi:MAG TPA: DUF11 domain-containing protein, partial [Allocoleopsis sp.]